VSEEATTLTEVLAGAVRRPRNRAAGARGTIHDDVTARGLGFRAGTVAGSVHMDQFVPLLVDAFGPGWFERGSLSLYFRQATADGEPVQAFLQRPGGRAQVRAWMTTAEGAMVAEGTASLGRSPEPSALHARDLRPVDPGRLRIFAGLRPGQPLDPVEVTADGARQREAIEAGAMTEPLPWYTGASPWGGPIAAPSTVVHLLYRDLLAPLQEATGHVVGLFGAIEVRFDGGPVFLDRSYRVAGEVVALSETPQTEVLWFDSRTVGAGMRMMLRKLKAASPLYAARPEVG
jgi:hypothetical protein